MNHPLPEHHLTTTPGDERGEHHPGDALRDTTIAITGGTGSFGSTMARRLLKHGVKKIHILSRDEAKQHDMRVALADERITYFVGDVRDRTSVDAALRGTDHVFHAAALKQVPSCEFFPQQAVLTNVLGSHNVIMAAHEAGARSLVCLSTDKAVYPVNAMGMSKALMEKHAQAFTRQYPDSPTTVTITRYGNVMYSRGSVIPHFINQIHTGRPITITEPDMTRFLMSLEESVDLVTHAFTNGTPGDLYVRKAPAATINTLAKAVATLLGHPDHPIHIIGMRHGEKMHETLLSHEEMAHATDQGNYFRVPVDARSMEYELYFTEGDHHRAPLEDYTSANTQRLNLEETITLLLTLPHIRELAYQAGTLHQHETAQP
ncbi:SDR family NAD(P)-dependent oxidoreductase [Dermatophilus congolensis]|nr:SDR family NAD(P)-dependent oxidoreductase [Dermatophilus congolensis]MBO3143343.1 SDR family NAD(P)-dependent oxidoreductase [Dermatophilus congolensis]MBO3152331.1 SDR family NAD(P)-dependent oxidoreductase [Dermatophilus congolensis]MBO3160658.1 SDR family NAD(P)-dependent oxidoreductase [Dermatophilus congolensis]MBO3163620.1 SDR family NAD(P)-dependent oxidoreductase [Dermatophilus congolensis]MBO3177165.1 SDR family NAD(P)-dependent oxidoreductase [Dermatophilus congolensis]